MDPINEIPISQIVPGGNDRTIFDEQSLKELADSIKEHGLIEPIIVRPTEDCDSFEVVAGERRFRASKMAGLKAVPAIIKVVDDEEASTIMLTENVNRKDLDAIDEARAFQNRINRFGWTIEDLSEKVKVSTIHIRFRLKLLKLGDELQKLVRGNNMQMGYAQIIADADLDSNYQLLAFSKFRDNPKPTPGWFRIVVADLKVKQDQKSLFNGPLFDGTMDYQEHTKQEVLDPPHPSTTAPPRIGRTLKEVILNQKSFWEDAAEEWAILGKPFKKQECQSAAQALNLAIR